MTLLEVAKQALEALEYSEGGWAVFNPVITYLRSAIEQAEKAAQAEYQERCRLQSVINAYERGDLVSKYAPTIPEGWRLVPEELTTDMLSAAILVGCYRNVGRVYKAMLAAAPHPEGKR